MRAFLAAYRSLSFYARAADITNDAAIECATAWLMMLNVEMFRMSQYVARG